MFFVRFVTVVFAAVLAMLLVGCQIESPDVTLRTRLTPEGQPYVVTHNSSQLVVTNIDSGGNNREIYWDESTDISSSATQCTTWLSGTDIAQNGMAFRIQRVDGGVNAIVFERNIWAYAFWMFVPIMFHSGTEYSEAFDSVDGVGVDLSSYLGNGSSAVWPLRVCAALDNHDVLRFAVAKFGDSMPPLDNPGLQGGSMKLDVAKYFHGDQARTGHNGGVYVAHVPNGTSLVVQDNTLDGLPAMPGLPQG